MTSAEIKQAMVNFSPVVYKGIVYKKINAYIYRIYENPHSHKYREAFQVELLDKNGQSVTIAEAKDIKLFED